MTSPIDYQALESQKNSKTYSKEIDKALNVPLSQEERELADLASETEKSQVLKKNIDMTGKIMLDVVRPEALRRLSKIDSKVLDDAIQYLKDNNTEVYTALNAWIHKWGRTSVPKNYKAVAVSQALVMHCCNKTSTLEHILLAFPNFRKSKAIDGDYGINTYRATKAVLDDKWYKTPTGEGASVLGVDEFKFLLDAAKGTTNTVKSDKKEEVKKEVKKEEVKKEVKKEEVKKEEVKKEEVKKEVKKEEVKKEEVKKEEVKKDKEVILGKTDQEKLANITLLLNEKLPDDVADGSKNIQLKTAIINKYAPAGQANNSENLWALEQKLLNLRAEKDIDRYVGTLITVTEI